MFQSIDTVWLTMLDQYRRRKIVLLVRKLEAITDSEHLIFRNINIVIPTYLHSKKFGMVRFFDDDLHRGDPLSCSAILAYGSYTVVKYHS